MVSVPVICHNFGIGGRWEVSDQIGQDGKCQIAQGTVKKYIILILRLAQEINFWRDYSWQVD